MAVTVTTRRHAPNHLGAQHSPPFTTGPSQGRRLVRLVTVTTRRPWGPPVENGDDRTKPSQP
jgi:hypothetical protein